MTYYLTEHWGTIIISEFKQSIYKANINKTENMIIRLCHKTEDRVKGEKKNVRENSRI